MIRRTSFSRAAVAALVLAAGMAVAADPLPVAPPPREAKPAKAKIDPALLIGKWQVIDQSYEPLPPGTTKTMEYGKDGRYRFEILSVEDPPWHQTGSYIVDGGTLGLQSDVPVPGKKRTRMITIESITKDKMVLSGQIKYALVRLRAK